MNRTIKFRVYDYDMKKMRYLNGDHDFICFDEKGNGYYHNMQTGLGEWFSELMQYTGLTDKNGVEIYEGDIITFESGSGGREICLIYYDEQLLSLNMKWYPKGYVYDGLSYLRRKEKIEVIGNIYESEVTND